MSKTSDNVTKKDQLIVRAPSADAMEQSADEYTRKSHEDLELESRQEDVKRLRAENERLRDNNSLRKSYASKVFRYLTIYSIFVGVLIVADGFQCHGFTLDTQVASYLVGSTAASAIGLVASVTIGLFGKDKS